MQPAHIADLGQQRAAFVECIGLAGFAGPRRGQDAFEVAIDVSREAQDGHDASSASRTGVSTQASGRVPRNGCAATNPESAAYGRMNCVRPAKTCASCGAIVRGCARRPQISGSDDAMMRPSRSTALTATMFSSRNRGVRVLRHAATSLLRQCSPMSRAAGAARKIRGQRRKARVTRPSLAIRPPLGDEYFERLGLGIEQRGQPLRAQVMQRSLDSHVHPRRRGGDRGAQREDDQALPAPARQQRRAHARRKTSRIQRRRRRRQRISGALRGWFHGRMLRPSVPVQFAVRSNVRMTSASSYGKCPLRWASECLDVTSAPLAGAMRVDNLDGGVRVRLRVPKRLAGPLRSGDRAGGSNEAIPASGHCGDETRLAGVVVERRPQLADGGSQHRVGYELVAPNLIEQSVRREQRPGLPYERAQDCEWRRRERDSRSVAQQACVCLVELEPVLFCRSALVPGSSWPKIGRVRCVQPWDTNGP